MIPVLSLHDKHDFANAVGSFGDIHRSDKFIAGRTSIEDVVIHMVLHIGILTFPANHGVEALTAIEVVIADSTFRSIAYKIVIAILTNHAIKKLPSAGIRGRGSVEIRTRVKIRRVAVEGIIAFIT
ncbi:MAG: hypothetical protein NTZ94_02275 [Verrucomicrobia bacterium]|nr:hypothetical protein [Verrucomicrobiota bacterium]